MNNSSLTLLLLLFLLAQKSNQEQEVYDMNPHPPFEEEPNLWDPMQDRPPEHQVIKLTG